MSAILLSPHADDETLFAAYTCLRFKPTIVCCTMPKESERVDEFYAACDVLDCHGVIQNLLEGSMTEGALERLLQTLGGQPTVYAPAVEDGGHEEHNLVGASALRVFDNVVPYLTYRRGSGRTHGTPVPFEPHWPGLKLRAMSYYSSQIVNPSTRPWFESDWIEEFYA